MYYPFDWTKQRREKDPNRAHWLFAYSWTRNYQRNQGHLPTLRRHTKAYQMAWRIVAQRKMVR